MLWIAFLLYVAVIALGCFLLYYSFQVGVRRKLSWTRSHGQPLDLAQAQRIATPMALIAGFAGVAVLAFAVLVPLRKIPFGTWHFYLGFIASVATLSVQLVKMRALKTASERHEV